MVNQTQSQNNIRAFSQNIQNSSSFPLQNINNNITTANNLLQYLNSAQRNISLRNQENSSTNNQNDNFNINLSYSLNNPRFISFDNSNNNNNIIQENDLNQNNINNENGDFFFNNNFEGKLTQAHNGILTLINEERKKIKESQETVEKLRADYIVCKRKELEKLEKEKNELKHLFKLYNGVSENDILELNIGGTHEITTTRATLTKFKNSALAVFFSGQSPTPMLDDKIFIDRDGEQFINLVNFLRTGKFPIMKNKEEENKFKDELNFWKITVQEKKIFTKHFEFDPDWCAPTLNLTENNLILKKNNPNHGVVFCKSCLDEYNPYIQFKVKINIAYKEKSQLFIGLVNKSKYKLANLSSKLWRDSPSSYYWDIWGSTLIKTNENGARVGDMKGYGCIYTDKEVVLGIKFDNVKRTISFYKNGIDHGVAFRNVPSGLTPSIDVWFQEGTVEIQNNINFEEKTYL